MLTANQLNLLITICDMTNILYSKVPERLLNSVDELISKKLVTYDNEVVMPTQKALLTVNAARSNMNFNYILREMNYRMLINLWHRIIEISEERKVHLNVIFKNLSDKHLLYIQSELNKAVESKKERDEILNLKY